MYILRVWGVKMIKLILTGRPITKKNSQIPIRTKSGAFFLIQSKQYRDYEKVCLKQIKEQYFMKPIITEAVSVKCLYYMPTEFRPDLLNLLQATADIISKKDKNKQCIGVIENDKNIVSFDGSRIIGKDKENPRAEVFIEEMMEIEC